MTFLNWAMLFGLLAVSVPIIIHLLNRRQARRIDWGAMRFLLASLTSRKRHIMIEEIILMAVRCLLVALLVLAMARPFMPSRTTIPWAVVLPAVLGSVVCLGVAAAAWNSQRLRYALLASSAALLLIAAISTAFEYYSQKMNWSSSRDSKDVAIVIDGSASMTLLHEGKTNFQRALEEAQAAIEACESGDAVSIILGGPMPQGVVRTPISDRKKLLQALAELKPAGGTMKALEAMNAASASLAEGQNTGKRIVVITDAQNLGWDLANNDRWHFLANGLASQTTRSEVVCRTLSVPGSFENLAATDIVLSRQVVGTDRPVRIDVKVANTGTGTVREAAVRLTVNGVEVAREKLAEIQPASAGTAHFVHQFDKRGMNVIAADVVHADAIAEDNLVSRVVHVVDRLHVLIVDGAPSDRLLDSAASYVELAFTPATEEDRIRLQAAKANPDSPPPPVRFLIDSDVREFTGLPRDEDFRRYSLVVLANVPTLSGAVAENLARFVREGGGLLIAPGERAALNKDEKNLRSFYNDWKTAAGETIAPAQIVQRRLAGEKPVRPAIKTFNHPALQLVTDLNRSDLDALMVQSYWQLAVSGEDKTVHLAAQFDNGDPMLVERSFGKGFVMMTAFTLDRRDSNLPSINSFLPLLHELASYLSAPLLAQPNVRPGAELTIDLPPRADTQSPAPASAFPLDANELEVLTPSRRKEPASCTLAGNQLRVRFTRTAEPGLYRCSLSPRLAQRFLAMPTEPACVPFTVLGDPAESSLATLTDADWQAMTRHLPVKRVINAGELKAAITGTIPGEELWRYLALAALAIVLSEIALTRWISSKRKSHRIETVDFGSKKEDAAALRARAKEMLAVPK